MALCFNFHLHLCCTFPLRLFQVMLRVKESEVQYLKQEINSLKDELHAAQRVCFLCQRETEIKPIRFSWVAISWFQDKKYATDKYKDIYTELSIVKAKAERDQGRLRDQLQLAHEALGVPTLEEVERGGYGMEGWVTPGWVKEHPQDLANQFYCFKSWVPVYARLINCGESLPRHFVGFVRSHVLRAEHEIDDAVSNISWFCFPLSKLKIMAFIVLNCLSHLFQPWVS